MSIVVTSKSGPDGKLRLEIPVDRPGAEFEIEIILRPKPPISPEEWRSWVQGMEGTVSDPTFERPPQLPLEERKPLS
ncbi:MAG TPA: hypothetical protein VGJ26_06190 [Pirellulales bacterium]|jgi:hypothetical protein